MMAAGKVSKFAEGVPSLKLNLKRIFREKNRMKISHNESSLSKIIQFSSLLFPFSISPFPYFSLIPYTHEDGISDYD